MSPHWDKRSARKRVNHRVFVLPDAKHKASVVTQAWGPTQPPINSEEFGHRSPVLPGTRRGELRVEVEIREFAACHAIRKLQVDLTAAHDER